MSLVFLLPLLVHAVDKLPAIPVVHTWGDLLQSPPLTVSSERIILPGPKPDKPGPAQPVEVRIGIDRDHVANDGAIVLYCAIKGVSFFPGADEDELGPLRFWEKPPQEAQAAAVTSVIRKVYQQPPDITPTAGSWLLFVTVIPLDGAGVHTVCVAPVGENDPAEKGKPIASAEVQVGRAVSPESWSPWGRSPFNNDGEAAYDHAARATVCNPAGGVAVPKAPGDFQFFDKVPDSAQPLPSLLPKGEDPGIRIKWLHNTLVITLDRKIDGYFPDDLFLTRWWRNGRPWVPDPAKEDPMPEQARAQAAQGWDTRTVHFQLDFRPERMNAQKGDRIGAQVLLCPYGWQSMAAPLQAMLMQEDRASYPPPLPSLSFASNRVEFTYTGDPGHPVAR